MGKLTRTGVRTSNDAAIARLQARLDGVSEARLRTAGNRALASVRRKFEPAAKRAIRETYNVRVGDLGGKFKVYSGSDGDGEFIELAASTRGIPLIRFGAKWRKRQPIGATAQVQLGQGKTYRSAFIATVNGQRHVFARQFSADSNSPSGRDPRNKLRRLMGPSPAQMVTGYGEQTAKRIGAEMNSFLSTEIKRQLNLARKAV